MGMCASEVTADTARYYGAAMEMIPSEFRYLPPNAKRMTAAADWDRLDLGAGNEVVQSGHAERRGSDGIDRHFIVRNAFVDPLGKVKALLQIASWRFAGQEHAPNIRYRKRCRGALSRAVAAYYAPGGFREARISRSRTATH